VKGPDCGQGLAQRPGVQGTIAAAPFGQMGAQFGGRDRPEVGQPLGFPPMTFEEGQIQPADMAIGFQRTRRQPTFVGQMLQPGGQGLEGRQLSLPS